MSAKFDTLPALVLSLICTYVRDYPFSPVDNVAYSPQVQLQSPKTLRSLPLVNKTCHHAVIPLLYRNLAIQVYHRQELYDRTAEIEKASWGRHFLEYARCVKVFGRMPLLEEEDDWEGEGPAWQEQDDAEFHFPFSEDLPDGTQEEVCTAWYPLVLLIGKLQYITDFVWVCRNQLPPNVLQAIEQHHPSCRLHMRTFRLRSLTSSGVTDRGEQDLIQSPILYSISIRMVGRWSIEPIDYNVDAIFQVLALAPNLKHLVIVGPRTASHPRRPANLAWPEDWKGFVSLSKDFKQGALESFVHMGTARFSLNRMMKLTNHTHLSKIRHLRIGTVVEPQILRFMNERIHLDSLEVLELYLHPERGADQHLMISMFESLSERVKPLKEIYSGGCITHTLLDQLLQRLGPTLRRLYLGCSKNDKYPLQPPSSTELIQKCESYCPFLEYLHITVPCPSSLNSLNDCSIVDFCPNLQYLRELDLDFAGENRKLPLKDAAKKIWDLIHREGVCHLRALHIDHVYGCGVLVSIPSWSLGLT